MIRTTSLLGLAGLGLAIALIIYEGFGSVLGDLYIGGIGLVWASLFHFIPMTINAYAWRALVVGDTRPSLLAFTWTVWVREAVNGLLPVARVGGEVVSVALLMRRGLTGRFAVGTIIVDMTLSIVSQFLFTVMGLCMLLARTDDIATLERIALGLLLMVPVVIAFVAVQKIGLFELLRRLLKGLFGANWPALTDGSADLDDTIRLIYRNRMGLASCFFWQFVGWLVGAGEIYLALRFLGHPIDIEDSLMLEALAQAVSSAAFIVPGAVGVQEGGYVLFGALLGLGPDISLALALARRVRDLLIFVPALVVWQFSEGRRFFASDWFRRFFRREKMAAPSVVPVIQDDD
jgi:putative membrane protein